MAPDVQVIGLEEIEAQQGYEAVEIFTELITDFKAHYQKLYAERNGVRVYGTAIFKLDPFSRKFTFVKYEGDYRLATHELVMKDDRMKYFL